MGLRPAKQAGNLKEKDHPATPGAMPAYAPLASAEEAGEDLTEPPSSGVEHLFRLVDEDGSKSLDETEVKHLVQILLDELVQYDAARAPRGAVKGEEKVQQLLADPAQIFRDMRACSGEASDDGSCQNAVTQKQFSAWWQCQEEDARTYVEQAVCSAATGSEGGNLMDSADPGTRIARVGQEINSSVIGHAVIDTVSDASEMLRGNIIGARETEELLVETKVVLKGATDSSWRIVKDLCVWAYRDLPRYPQEFYYWVLEPVPYGDGLTEADWWKLFTFQFVAFAFPPFLFWDNIHKTLPGGDRAINSQARLQEFVKRCWWLGSSLYLIFEYSHGELSHLSRSEIFFNVMLYAFQALVSSHEAASLKKPSDQKEAMPKHDVTQSDGENLPSYAKYVALSGEIAMSKQAAQSLGLGAQRLHELDSINITNARFESFDAQGFEEDFAKELHEGLKQTSSAAKTAGASDFSRRLNEIIVGLGRHVPWFRDRFDAISNPHEGDPQRHAKEMQYLSCLLSLRQQEVARLRNDGKSEAADRLEKRLNTLEFAQTDIARTKQLLERLERLGLQQRPLCLRLVPPMLMCAIFAYLGDCAQLFGVEAANAGAGVGAAEAASGVEVEASAEGYQNDTVREQAALAAQAALADTTAVLSAITVDADATLERTFQGSVGTSIARVLALVFMYMVLATLLRWFASTCFILCCKRCVEDKLDSEFRETLDEAENFFKQPRRQFRSMDDPESSSHWSLEQAKHYLGINMEANTGTASLIDDRCAAVANELSLRKKSKETWKEVLDRFVADELTNGHPEQRQGRCVRSLLRKCTESGQKQAQRQKRLKRVHSQDMESGEEVHEDRIDVQRLRLATWRYHTKEVIDNTFDDLSAKLRLDMRASQCKQPEPSKHIPAGLLVLCIRNLAEFRAQQLHDTQFKYVVLGTLMCASCPWLHDLILGCFEDRTCGYHANNSESDFGGSPMSHGNTSLWVICPEVAPPHCTLNDQPHFQDSHLCSMQHPGMHIGMTQLHKCGHESDFETFWRWAAAATEMSLTFSIFSRLLLVLKGYYLRHVFMEYFASCVAWPGMQAYRQSHNTYGLIPQFELDCPDNVVAYNRMRVYLQTFEADEFSREQQQVFWVVLISIGMLIAKVIDSISDSESIQEQSTKELVDTLALKSAIMQLLALIVVFKLLWVGVNTTRMQEHGLRHILLLKRAQLCNVKRPLFFSGSREVAFLAPSSFSLTELQAAIESKLGITVTHQRITVHGVHASKSSARSAPERARYGKLRKQLLQQRYGSSKLGPQQEKQLQFVQNFFRKNDAMQPIKELQKLEQVLLEKSRKLQQEFVSEDAARLEWVQQYLPAGTHHTDDTSAAGSDGESSHTAAPTTPRSGTASEHGRRGGGGTQAVGSDGMALVTVAKLAASRVSQAISPTSPFAHVQQQQHTSTTTADSQDSSEQEDGGALVRTRTDKRRISGYSSSRALSVPPRLPATNENDDQGPSALTLDASTDVTGISANDVTSIPIDGLTEHWTKFMVHVHDGKDISVTQEQLTDKDQRMLRDKYWGNQIYTKSGVKGTVEQRFVVVYHTSEYDHKPLWKSNDWNAQKLEQGSRHGVVWDRQSWEEWERVDTLRHMLDSLVSIMEEERLPVQHLPTIEDTRPTIRVPFYGPLPITTQLFATIATSMLGAFATCVTFAIGDLVLQA